MTKQQAMSLLTLISDLYTIILTPDAPVEAASNGKGSAQAAQQAQPVVSD